MKRKGYQFKRARHLTFRYVQARDLEEAYRGTMPRDIDRMTAYAVIVPVQACLDDEDEASTILRTSRIDRDKLQAAKALPITGWSRTNMVYGIWRKQTRGRRFWVKLSSLSKEHQKAWRDNYKHDSHCGIDTSYWYSDEGGVQVHHWCTTYWTKTIYWVEDAIVYTATTHTHEDPTS
jgi:hypothetical protein